MKFSVSRHPQTATSTHVTRARHVGAGDAPLPAEVLALLADRDDARDAKDYSAADAIRDDVRDLYELRIDDRNRRCLPHAPPVAPRAPPTATPVRVRMAKSSQ